MMRKREIILDFTSLLDIMMIILFFFILFSHVETEGEKVLLQEKQEQAAGVLLEAQQRLDEANDRLAEAGKIEELAAERFAEAEAAVERSGENADGIMEFMRSTNIRIRLKMEGDGNWSLMVYRGEELLSEIVKSSTQEMAEKLLECFMEEGFHEEDTLLCELIYNGAEAGTNSAYHMVDNILKLTRDEYRHFFYSTIDLSVYEEEER